MYDMSKIITVFSHKGGIGKTTFCYNISYELASRDKKVLVIDGDSQMNLTACLHGLSTNVEYVVENGEKWIETLREYKSFESYLKEKEVIPVAEKDVFPKEIFRRNLTNVINKKNELELNLPIKSKSVCVDILGSSKDFFKVESDLQQFAGVEDRPRKFQKALREISANYDFTIIDTSPSANSTMNGLLVFSADYLIVPAAPTFFSLQAMDNLKSIWLNWEKRVHEARLGYGFKIDCKFLGTVFQMARRYANDDSKFAKHADDWMKQINDSAKRSQVSFFSDNKIDDKEFSDIFGLKNNPFIIEKCCDFTQRLRSQSDRLGVPILALGEIKNDSNLKFINLKQYREVMKDTKESYKNIADGLLKLL